MTEVSPAIHRAVSFLARRQLPWGELATFRHGDALLSGDGQLDSSPFVTTFVLHALDFVQHPAAETIRAAALAFLVAEREEPGVWRYWTSRQGSPIDPDLDDTCCASFALRGVAGVRNSTQTILGNRHPSGLFKTWLRHPVADNDVDGVVNANVLLCLGERDETKAACEIVADAINEGRETEATWYYVTPLALYYMVARAFHHGVLGFAACRGTILQRIQDAGSPDDAMHAALSLATRASFAGKWDDASERWLHTILSSQTAEGGWPRRAFYTGPEPPAPHAVWWGSEELTTAFCLEALARSPYNT